MTKQPEQPEPPAATRPVTERENTPAPDDVKQQKETSNSDEESDTNSVYDNRVSTRLDARADTLAWVGEQLTVAQREVNVVPHAAPPSAITRVAVLQEIRARLTVDETRGNDSNNLEEVNRGNSRKSNEDEETAIADS